MYRNAIALALLLIVAPGYAQISTSTIAGVVTDESNAAVPGAQVTVEMEGTGLKREAATNQNGEYVIPQLSPGRYRISVTAAGFQTAVVENLTLAIAQREVANVTLRVGQITEQVTVSAAAAPLTETETASLGQLISRRAINDLPLNGRNYITLGALSPGVIPQLPASTGPASFVAATTQRSDRSILVGGQRESSTSYLFDGVEMPNPRIGDTSITPSLDVVQEFKIQRNFFQAEFGNSPGIINVASRGGTNEWHGSVFWFLRNNAMDARNFFARSVEPFKRNQYGAAGGGPVRKDKVFVFGNYEGLRQRLGVIQRGIYPTQRQLNGDFSSSPTIHDPLTFNAATNSRTPFPGNMVPSQRFNRIARNFLPYIPATNNPVVGGANLEGTPVQKLDDDQVNVRGDWLINSNHSLFGRFSWQDAPLLPAALAPLGGRQVTSKGVATTVQLTSSLSPAHVNVFRASYSYANLFGKQVDAGKDIAAEIGITGVSTVPLNWGVPNVGWQGYSGIGSDGLTQGNIIHNYQLSDSMTWVKSSHTLKFGYEIRQSRNLLDSDNSPRGNFVFGASYTAALDPATGNPVARTGEPVADFLLGYPTNMNGAVGTSLTHFQFHTHNIYAQDDWKVSKEITLNYGLRYEFIGPPEPNQQELRNIYGFDFNTGKQLFPVLGQIRNSVIKPDYADFAPRVGLAYNPAWMSSVVIRGGAGIYFDQTQMNETQFVTNGPPVFRQQNLNATGRGLPEFEFGRNTLPVVPIPPVDSNYVTPPGTFLFAQEIDGRKPRVYMWTFSVQKSFAANWVVEADYVGAKGVRLSKRYNSYANATPGILYDVTPGVATRYPQLNGMLYSSQAGWSKFHALNLKVERRFAGGLSLLGAHTWAKSIDTDSGGAFGTPNLNPANFQLDIGPSDYDIRHRFVTSAVWELPFGKGKKWLSGTNHWLEAVIGGWQFQGWFEGQSGYALGFGNAIVRGNLRELVLPVGERTTDAWFNLEAANRIFERDPAKQLASNLRTLPLRFSFIRADGINNWDLSLFKNYRLTERFKLQFRAESFNALNHVQFANPATGVTNTAFGTITGEKGHGQRQWTFGLKLMF